MIRKTPVYNIEAELAASRHMAAVAVRDNAVARQTAVVGLYVDESGTMRFARRVITAVPREVRVDGEWFPLGPP